MLRDIIENEGKARHIIFTELFKEHRTASWMGLGKVSLYCLPACLPEACVSNVASSVASVLKMLLLICQLCQGGVWRGPQHYQGLATP